MRIKDIANAYLILALVLGAMMPVMLKIALQNINIYEYLMLTYMVALPSSFIYVLARKKTDKLISGMRNIKEFAFIAFLGLLNYGMLEFGLSYAEKFVSASLATVVYRTFPLLMLIFLPIMLRERITRYQLMALLAALAGLYIAMSGGGLSIFSNANLPILALVVAIALASAFVSVAIKKYSFDMEIAMFMFNLATFVFFASLFMASHAPLQPLNYAALLSIVYVGIVYNVFVGLMYYGALRMIKTTFVTNIYFLSPFITFVFSWLILGERIYVYYVAIAILVSVGIIIQKFDRRGGTYVSKSAASARHTFHDVTSAFINTDVPLIYNAIKTGGRVLAIRLDAENYTKIRQKVNGKPKGGSAFLYTSDNRKMLNGMQDEFIREIMGVNEDDIVLMSAGMPDSCEKLLHDALS